MNIIITAYEKALHYFKTADGTEIDHQALAFAIAALEKQVPKKNQNAQVISSMEENYIAGLKRSGKL